MDKREPVEGEDSGKRVVILGVEGVVSGKSSESRLVRLYIMVKSSVGFNLGTTSVGPKGSGYFKEDFC